MTQQHINIIGEPYVMECPECRKLHIVDVTFGSSCFMCDCSPNEFIRFDFISKDAIKENHEKYKEMLKPYLK